MASVDHRSAAEIEREIEVERSALQRTLDEIQDRLSFETLSNDLFGRVRDNSGEIGRSVVRSVKDNPIPIALTAVGLAWLIASQRSSARSDDAYGRVAATPASGRWQRSDQPGMYPLDPEAAAEPAPLYDASGRPIEHDEESRWDRARGTASEAGHSASDSLRSGRDHASSSVSSAAARARAGYESGSAGAGRGISRASGAVRRRAQGAYASANELRQRITHGTEELSSAARKRVIAARTRAYEAQLRAEHYASRGREKAADLYEDQPMVAGALALAFGAALGSLLPRTHREDAALGAYRDQVFEEAERIYREERAKLEAVARETASEARHVARDVAEDVRSDLKEGAQRTGEIARAKLSETEAKAKEGANQVAETARSEADKQRLGQP